MVFTVPDVLTRLKGMLISEEISEREDYYDIFTGRKVEELLHDVFVAGYAFGHNDCLAIIRDQLSIDNWMKYTSTINKSS